MASSSIRNSIELRAEIARLKGLESYQKTALALRFNSPKAIFLTLKSLFPQSAGKASVLFHPDTLNMAARFLLPLTLNKTIFKHSNFLVRSLAGLISPKAAGYVTERSVAQLLEKGKVIFSKSFNKPISETSSSKS